MKSYREGQVVNSMSIGAGHITDKTFCVVLLTDGVIVVLSVGAGGRRTGRVLGWQRERIGPLCSASVTRSSGNKVKCFHHKMKSP